jgi:hypothetical protein
MGVIGTARRRFIEASRAAAAWPNSAMKLVAADTGSRRKEQEREALRGLSPADRLTET